MRVVIESSVPLSSHDYDGEYKSRKPVTDNSRYYIHIDEDDGSNIDLTVKLAANKQHAQIRSNGRYLTEQTDSRQTNYNNRNDS